MPFTLLNIFFRSFLFMSFEKLLNDLEILSTDQKGKLFEKICFAFLKHDKFYKTQFDNIWFWKDWPENNNQHDTGIDIIAKLKNSDKYCAIQCKCYSKNIKIQKSDVDSFLSLSSKNIYAQRIFIALHYNFTANALDAFKGQNPKCDILTGYDLQNSSIDWDKFDPDNLDKIACKIVCNFLKLYTNISHT